MRSLSAAAMAPDISFISGPSLSAVEASLRGTRCYPRQYGYLLIIATGRFDIVSMSQRCDRNVNGRVSLIRRFLSIFSIDGSMPGLERRARQEMGGDRSGQRQEQN